jgi:hypothetical protein
VELTIILGGVALMIAYLLAYSRWRRWEIERDRKRRGRRVPAGGLVAPFDEVFHPTAYEAHLLWDAQTELPAPAPNSDGGRPDLDSGRITLSVPSSAPNYSPPSYSAPNAATSSSTDVA